MAAAGEVLFQAAREFCRRLANVLDKHHDEALSGVAQGTHPPVQLPCGTTLYDAGRGQKIGVINAFCRNQRNNKCPEWMHP